MVAAPFSSAGRLPLLRNPPLVPELFEDENEGPTSYSEIASTPVNYLVMREVSSSATESGTLGKGRFLSPDVLQGKLEDPQTWNRYAYARNNPLKYVDPDGKAFDTFVDAVFIAYDLFDIGRTVARGDTVTETQFKALGGDVFGALIPGLTGVGAGIRRIGDLDGAAKLVQKTKSLDSVADAYEIAKQGGRHAGLLRNYESRSLREITKAMRSYEANVADHLEWIAHPTKHVKNWAELSARRQQNLLKHWKEDVRRNRELAELMRRLAALR